MTNLDIRQLADLGGTKPIAPITVPEAVLLENGDTLDDKLDELDAVQNNIATIETSPTTNSYSKGDYLVYNSQLYRVTADIAIGGTLTVGTNIEGTKVGDELSSLNSKILSILQMKLS